MFELSRLLRLANASRLSFTALHGELPDQHRIRVHFSRTVLEIIEA